MSNIWLKMPGIAGDSMDHGHEGKIDVLSYRWGLSKVERNPTGKATAIQNLTIVHVACAFSSSLIGFTASNKVTDKAVFSWRKPDAQAIPGGQGKAISRHTS
ncbi:hypothetical protein NK8_34490 [Caballeronia sp. NK8]|uniref:type VI secretion system tube protein Hcp n=1 Tax=Caballeronia sp. NK8 TaxID=140098 RepID=UPI001BB628EC|nr:type VI secretion system tube protein Hcp [Caballeronia sp. NK8]BCQ25272.1 hypothetical protein NK8_34490 [Caballeronia sp. NK8]